MSTTEFGGFLSAPVKALDHMCLQKNPICDNQNFWISKLERDYRGSGYFLGVDPMNKLNARMRYAEIQSTRMVMVGSEFFLSLATCLGRAAKQKDETLFIYFNDIVTKKGKQNEVYSSLTEQEYIAIGLTNNQKIIDIIDLNRTKLGIAYGLILAGNTRGSNQYFSKLNDNSKGAYLEKLYYYTRAYINTAVLVYDMAKNTNVSQEEIKKTLLKAAVDNGNLSEVIRLMNETKYIPGLENCHSSKVIIHVIKIVIRQNINNYKIEIWLLQFLSRGCSNYGSEIDEISQVIEHLLGHYVILNVLYPFDSIFGICHPRWVDAIRRYRIITRDEIIDELSNENSVTLFKYHPLEHFPVLKYLVIAYTITKEELLKSAIATNSIELTKLIMARL